MTGESSNDRRLREMITDALTKDALRADDPEAIERMLDALDDGPMEADQVERILGKLRGTTEPGSRDTTDDGDFSAESTEEELALYRENDGDLPPEVQKKLAELRRKALEEDKGDSKSE